MPVPTWIEQQWIRITRILLGVCPPTRRGKGRHRGNQLSILQPSDWGHWHRTTIPSTIDASQLDVLAPFEAQGRGFEHGHGKGHGIVGTTSSTIDASQLDASRISDDHAHAPDHALGLIPISQLTMPGCRWADVINR